jgi:metal-sulfur cluster biosynthetic enzyme
MTDAKMPPTEDAVWDALRTVDDPILSTIAAITRGKLAQA